MKETIKRMDCMACKRCRYFPSVVLFMYSFVDVLVVHETVDPVYACVSEHDECYHFCYGA